MNSVWTLITLQFYTNRNYFFERYAFLKKKISFTLHLFLYIFGRHLLPIIVLLLFISVWNLREVALLMVLGVLAGFFIHIDNSDWKLFEQKELVLSHPKVRQRFLVILGQNLIFKLSVENNFIVFALGLCTLLRFSPFESICLITSLFFLFVGYEVYYFVVQYSTLRAKKIISAVQYAFSSLVTATVFSLLIYNFISIATFVISHQLSRDAFFRYLYELYHIHQIKLFVQDSVVYLLVMSLFVCLACTSAAAYSLRNFSLRDKTLLDNSRYVVANFWLLRQLQKLPLTKKDTVEHSLVAKEYQFFATTYRYNFRDYLFTFLADRSVYLMIAYSYLMAQYPSPLTSLLFCLMATFMLSTDISSATSTKLAANMSFAGDYNTLRNYNMNSLSLAPLFNAKLKFFYSMKAFSFLIFFAVFNTAAALLSVAWPLLLLLNLTCLYMVVALPRLYFTNNLIYIRMNYKDADTFIVDGSLLESALQEFFPFRIFKQINTLLFLTLVILGLLFPNITLPVPATAVIIVQSILFCFLHTTMGKVQNNIFSFIERGDYSANFAKIFKQQKNLSRN